MTGLLPPTERPEIEPRVPEDWIGYDLGLTPGTWRYAGKATLSESAENYAEPVYDSDAPSVRETGRQSFITVDPETRDIYEIAIDPETSRALAQHMTRMGYAAPPPSADEGIYEAASEDFVPKGWSGGVDDREPKSIDEVGVNQWPIRAIGALKYDGTAQNANGHCTASFLSPGSTNTRYVITAAHCLYDTDGDFIDTDFWPRQDSCQTTQGDSVSGCDQGPYGQWDGGAPWIWSYYANNCAGNSTPSGACMANDIALVTVTRQSGASYSGGFNIGYYYPWYLNNKLKLSRGYPNCNSPGDPNPSPPQVCLPRTLYGDGFFSIDGGSWFSGDFPRVYAYSADTSKGHSGSPSFFYNSTWGYVVFGANTYQTCVGSSCSGTLVNYMRALDAGTYNSMLTFMGL